MLYISGRISDHKIVEATGIYSDVVSADYKAAIAKNYGGIAADYSIFTLDKSDPAFERIQSGEKWEAVWSGSAIVGVDFSAYDAKYFITFEADRTEVLADGSDSCTITIKLTDPDGKDLSNDVPGIYIPVQSPLCQCTKKLDISSGNTKFDFRTVKPGAWKFPPDGIKMISDYRVKNQVTIEALLV